MERASVRIRPLRFAFAVSPKDLTALMRIFEANTILWGGPYNFIIPLFKQFPQRYMKPYHQKTTATALVDGLIEAFQPDFIVEMVPGSTKDLRFPRDRVITFDLLLSRDSYKRCVFGVDIRSVIADLYENSFRFVQRHPLETIIPFCSDPKYSLLFAAIFGNLPEAGPLADCAEHFSKALDAKKKNIAAGDYPTLFHRKYLFPLRASIHELETLNNSIVLDSKLYYMNERSPLDLIDFWNLRALGWDITPLPASLAPQLKPFCEEFIKKSYRPFPAPSNAYHDASFLCSPHYTQDELHGFISSLKRDPGDASSSSISLDMRVPRIWEEWGRSADHAQPQTVTYETKPVDTYMIGQGLHASTAIPEFLEKDAFASQQHACANVFESISGGARVIPWGIGELTGLIGDFAHEKIWISQEGIVATSANFSRTRFFHAPTPLNVFSAFAKSKEMTLSISPAGETCDQIIKAVGGLQAVGTVTRSPELLHFLNSLANESFEVGSDITPSKKVRKAYAPYPQTLEVVNRATPGPDVAKSNFFKVLINKKVLIVGLTLRCDECNHKSWHSLNALAPEMSCPRCSSSLMFPAASPPKRDEWAYRVSGPFAAENFAHGAYCVSSVLHFVTEKIFRESTWLPSFRLTNAQGGVIEADFGMFVRPNRLSHATAPLLILGECKSFNLFSSDDFKRANDFAQLFPGAVICFATFREALTAKEIKAITKIVYRGRASLATGKIRNPVLILTGKELFSQFRWDRNFFEVYGEKSQYANMAYIRGDIQELCDFSQQIHLGLEPYHVWLDKKSKMRSQKAADVVN